MSKEDTAIKLEVDAKQAAQDLATAIAGEPLWRLQLVRVLQILGVVLGMTGTADFMNLLSMLSPQAAAWMALSGAALRFGAEPFILLVGDYLDDGVKNDSFKIPKGNLGLWLLVAFCTAFSIGCTGFSIGLKGDCALANYRAANGAEYETGPCVDLTTGKVNRYVTIWTNVDGVKIRVTRWTSGDLKGSSEVQYLAGDGSWLSWSSKSGVSLGGAPVVGVTSSVSER